MMSYLFITSLEFYIKKKYTFYFGYSDKKWNYHEDNIWSILVNKLASSKLCVNKPIYKYSKKASITTKKD